MDFIRRALEKKILEQLKTFPAVFLNGPRQAGKSTFVQELSKKSFMAEYLTLDNATQMSAASMDPTTFLKNRKNPVIIDEVQLVPSLFRPLKVLIDELRLLSDSANGHFLLTGSANILAFPALSDALVGRMGVISLYPLAVSEVLGNKGNFVERLFSCDFDVSKIESLPLTKAISLASFPEISGKPLSKMSMWFDAYISTLIQRDVQLIKDLEKRHLLPVLLRILATRAGSLLNEAEIARDIGLNPVSSKQYRSLLKTVFLTFDLAPWFKNISRRLVKSAKGYFTDTMLLCHVLGLNINSIEKNNRHLWGHVVENFVASELLKLISFSSRKIEFLHFRTAEGKEVDFVLEDASGRLVGVEVKSGASVSQNDFKGLIDLNRLVPDSFACGVVLYDGEDVIPFGQNFFALPFKALWS